MNILMSIRKPWTDMILNGSKKLEFRNNIGKNFKIGLLSIYMKVNRIKDWAK